MASIKRKNKDYSFNPASFLSGTHEFNPVGAISSWWNEEDEVDPKKKYIQTGGDMTAGEGVYDQRFATPDFLDEKMMQPLSGPSPSLPDRSADEPLPEFVSSQMERGPSAQQAVHGLDTEASRLKAAREFNPALASLDYQADPSLWDRTKEGITSLFSSDEEAQAGPVKTAVAQEQFEQKFGKADRRPSIPQPQSLLTATQGMEDYDDDLGNATDPEEEGEGLMAKLGGLMSSDSSKTKPLSKGKQAAVKLATSLLTAKDDPIQSAPVAGVKMGRVAFPNLLASSQRPVNPRYTPKGLG